MIYRLVIYYILSLPRLLGAPCDINCYPSLLGYPHGGGGIAVRIHGVDLGSATQVDVRAEHSAALAALILARVWHQLDERAVAVRTADEAAFGVLQVDL